MGQQNSYLTVVLDEFINYITVVKNYSQGTIPGYRSNLARFFESESIRIPSDITSDKAENYISKRLAAGISRNTNSGFMIALRAFITFCNKRGYTKLSIEDFEVPRRTLTRMEYVTSEEVNRMLDVIHRERDRLILQILYTSGCRVGELVQITVESLRNNRFYVIGKGNVPITYRFDQYVAERLTLFLYMNNIKTGKIFLKTNGEPLGKPAISHFIRKAAKLANIGRNVHPHEFRHGFATATMEAGADPRTIQVMLGHKDIKTTMRYMHVTDTRLNEVHTKYAPKVTSSDPLNNIELSHLSPYTRR